MTIQDSDNWFKYYYDLFSTDASGETDALEWALEGMGDDRIRDPYPSRRHQDRFMAAVRLVEERYRIYQRIVREYEGGVMPKSRTNTRSYEIAKLFVGTIRKSQQISPQKGL